MSFDSLVTGTLATFCWERCNDKAERCRGKAQMNYVCKIKKKINLKNGCNFCLADATLHRCHYKKDIATLMDNRTPAGAALGNSQAAKTWYCCP